MPDQFVKAAQSELERKRYDSALPNAVHSGISSTDSVTTALFGRRSTDPDHDRPVDLLEEAAGSASEDIKSGIALRRGMRTLRFPSSPRQRALPQLGSFQPRRIPQPELVNDFVDDLLWRSIDVDPYGGLVGRRARDDAALTRI